MANKQNLLLFRINTNLCEIDKEYPSLKQSSIPRQLSASPKLARKHNCIIIDKLPNRVIPQHQQNDPNKHGKIIKQETEIIDLFPYKQEEFNDKLYKKCRHQSRDNDDDDERDNKN